MLAKPSLYRSIKAVFKKDALCELRSYYAFSTLIAFAVTTLSSLSISMGGFALSPNLLAALLWVILFFSAMSGLSRVFVQEQDAGTFITLRVYALPQAVYWGKMIFNILLLAGLSIIVLLLFVVFFNVSTGNLPALLGVLLLGACGVAIVSTITAAMAAQTQMRSSLFTILTFPIILPAFLTAISLTAAIFGGEKLSYLLVLFLIGYDIAAAVAGSVLFDYLWLE